MKSTDFHLIVRYGTPNQTEDGNRYTITVSHAQTGERLFEYHGPICLVGQTVTQQAIGQAIMNAMLAIHRSI
jgi:hypothetical protein